MASPALPLEAEQISIVARAKTAQSKCRHCRAPIVRGALRVGKAYRFRGCMAARSHWVPTSSTTDPGATTCMLQVHCHSSSIGGDGVETSKVSM
jgi:hypothetical protein